MHLLNKLSVYILCFRIRLDILVVSYKAEEKSSINHDKEQMTEEGKCIVTSHVDAD